MTQTSFGGFSFWEIGGAKQKLWKSDDIHCLARLQPLQPHRSNPLHWESWIPWRQVFFSKTLDDFWNSTPHFVWWFSFPMFLLNLWPSSSFFHVFPHSLSPICIFWSVKTICIFLFFGVFFWWVNSPGVFVFFSRFPRFFAHFSPVDLLHFPPTLAAGLRPHDGARALHPLRSQSALGGWLPEAYAAGGLVQTTGGAKNIGIEATLWWTNIAMENGNL